MAELNRSIASNPDFPPFYGYRAEVHWRMGNRDAFVADRVMGMKKTGRLDEAEAFAAGYAKAS